MQSGTQVAIDPERTRFSRRRDLRGGSVPITASDRPRVEPDATCKPPSCLCVTRLANELPLGGFGSRRLVTATENSAQSFLYWIERVAHNEGAEGWTLYGSLIEEDELDAGIRPVLSSESPGPRLSRHWR